MSSSSISPTPSISITIEPTTTGNGLDIFTKLFLSFIFLSLFIRVCYVYITMRRDRDRDQRDNDEDNNINTLNLHAEGYGDDQYENQNHHTGLPISVIKSYHSFPYNSSNTANNNNVGITIYKYDTKSTCPICIEEYEESEMLRMMPQCRHYFHRDCVDKWLKFNASCPVCRNSLVGASNHHGANSLFESI